MESEFQQVIRQEVLRRLNDVRREVEAGRSIDHFQTSSGGFSTTLSWRDGDDHRTIRLKISSYGVEKMLAGQVPMRP